MLNMVETLAIVIASSSVVAAGVTVVMTYVSQRRWASFLLKRDACLAALDVVDGYFSHMRWGDVVPTQQPAPSVGEARRCHNLLVVTCRDPKVAELYLDCLGVNGPITPVKFHQLREAVRRECRLGRGALDPNLDRVWLAKVETQNG